MTRKLGLKLLSGLLLVLAGCSLGESEYLGGDLWAVNHASAAINNFSVNGYGGGNANPHGYGGGACCVMLPREWRPGILMKVEWETDPNTVENGKTFPGFVNREKFLAWKNNAESNFQRHSAIVPLPPYDQGLCALEVHFLPCHQVKVTTACWGYGSPNNPIKEPLEMKEPPVCPK
ncbi:DUF3304 domain-containing protein [Pseudomonas sp. PDM13]|uniref:DUF3304 domain-containing protein n=1 Tax=Pseudomonas sp. PDM13 TaxID=2769255 RepID=UPI0021E024F1|nr:DUF3304 domain-containing protein [Pseudomonas sp. PDM13]MCU9949058.1 DUF3304 domain-containing protein [Pseudomonas sp. PDM13]